MIPPSPAPRLACLVFAAFCFAAVTVHASSLRVVTLNVELGLGAEGSPGFEAAADILERIDADVVALQELDTPDFVGDPDSLEDLASLLNYPHIHVAERANVLDFGMRVAFLSRFPISSATNITSPSGARDMTRQIPAIVVDVPGTSADPTILTLHLKCCLDSDDPFRRAVELKRAADYLQSASLTAADNLIILGDFNLIGNDLTYASLPSTLPASFDLGDDVSFPVDYFMAPASYFQPWSMTALEARQLNGATNTQSSSRLDYILASEALTSRPHASEIYNSALDTSNNKGLTKSGTPLSSGTSAAASDHLAVFADFQISSPTPLSVSRSGTSFAEDSPVGLARLTVSSPVALSPGESIAVTVTSSDPTEAIPAQSTFTLTPASPSRVMDIIIQRDALLDGPQLVTLTVSAPGFSSVSAQIEVTDVNVGHYSIPTLGTALSEDFAFFDGSADHAQWPTTSGSWRGIDDGSGGAPGNYAYGADPSLGILLDTNDISTTATYHNDTGENITALRIAYDAEQWRSFQNGTADTLSAELIIGHTVTPLPELDFTTTTTLPSGPIADGSSASFTTAVPALSIAPGADFQLRFTATRGPGGGGATPDDVFINELHYDNLGADQNEFVEVVIGPGYPGSPAAVSLHFYNGNNGQVYMTETLDNFSLDHTTSSGHRLYSKLVLDIQNGSSDGIALVAEGRLLHFISYEGTLTAIDGPASGMTSTDIGVAQSGPVPDPGTGSLGLTGSGGDSAEFTWTRFASAPSIGAVNVGQSFTAPAGPQGIAIDKIALTALNDSDLDGLSDPIEVQLGTNPLLADSDGNGTDDGEEDSDGDGQSNLSEILVSLTDPADPSSRFHVPQSYRPATPQQISLTIPALPGRIITISRSHDLLDWTTLLSFPGSPTEQIRTVSGDPNERANFFRVEAVLP